MLTGSDISLLPVEERICCKVGIRCFLSNRSSGTVPNGPPEGTRTAKPDSPGEANVGEL
jgi:hypothetical protein